MCDEVVQLVSFSCKWVAMAEDGSLNLGDSFMLMPEDTWLKVRVTSLFDGTDIRLSLEL